MESSCKILVRDKAGTAATGISLARILMPGDLVLLSGDLGAGKTTFTKALAAGLGIDEREISSPSFSIIHEYPLPGGQGRFIHSDLYRLGPDADIVETGLEELINEDNIVVVEWGDILYDSDYDPVKIHISYDDYSREGTETSRHLCFHTSRRWRKRLEKAGLCRDDQVTSWS